MNQYQSLVNAATKSASDEQAQDQDEDATIKTAKAISRLAFHHELTDDEKKWAGPAVHYSLGSALGAVYGLAAEKLPVSTTGMGTGYGFAVWLGADEIAVPAMGFAQGPAETSLSSHANALASHLVYGIVTDLTRKLLLSAT
jgi:uncharacterized membrane protein YagU involved in acid resistance